jgi:hypothetical protein
MSKPQGSARSTWGCTAGPTLKGQFARTVSVSDVHTGWTENIAVKNGAHRWVLEAMAITRGAPALRPGRDRTVINGGEFINAALIAWAGERGSYFTRSRPYHCNDNAHLEHKNGDVVRRSRLPLPLRHHHRAAPAQPALHTGAGAFEPVHRDHQSNPISLQPQRQERPRLQQAPHPISASWTQGALSTEKTTTPTTLFDATNPADLTGQITALQPRLIHLATTKTTTPTTAASRAKPDKARTQLSQAS